MKVRDADGQSVQFAAIQLGRRPRIAVPQPKAGPPRVHEDAKLVVLEGSGFSLVFDKTKADFAPADSRHHAAVLRFPVPHMTQYDFGDLAKPRQPPYAVYPDIKTRQVEQVIVHRRPEGAEAGRPRPLHAPRRHDHLADRLQGSGPSNL